MKYTILLVDDEEAILFTMEAILGRDNFQVLKAYSGEEAIPVLREKCVDLVISDIHLGGGMDGICLLSKIKEMDSTIPVIMMTAFGNEEVAVEAMKKGAVDYLAKPFKSNEEIRVRVHSALNKFAICKKMEQLQNKLEGIYGTENIIGNSDCMKKIFDLISRVSKSEVTVLLTGESGTGKEVVANSIHYNSNRKKKPFIKMNCAAIPEELLESELFGHVKGSFTGAIRDKKGKFEMADTGTLFLDEIGDMSIRTQSKVLRVIQEREFERVGSSETINVDVRILAATHKNLELEIKKGNFREDLYYRLNVINLTIPPLRERMEDIPLLVDYFVRNFNEKFNRTISGVSQEVLEKLYQYNWPGNIRELRNVLERSVVLSRGNQITAEVLPSNFASESSISGCLVPLENISYKVAKEKVMAEFERRFICHVLKKTRGNIKKAAEMVEMFRPNFYQKMMKYDIHAEDFKRNGE